MHYHDIFNLIARLDSIHVHALLQKLILGHIKFY
jgi:hypothetical protein